MNIREQISVKTTPASKRVRRIPGYWNWPELIALVDKVGETGKEQMAVIHGTYLAVAKPRYQIVESAQTQEYKDTHAKVGIALYNLAFTLDVEHGLTVPFPETELAKITGILRTCDEMEVEADDGIRNVVVQAPDAA